MNEGTATESGTEGHFRLNSFFPGVQSRPDVREGRGISLPAVSRRCRDYSEITCRWIRRSLLQRRRIRTGFTGGCSGCPSAKYTLESIVKEEFFRYTDLVKDVKMAEGVSDELYDIAKRILRKKEGNKNCETESPVLCKLHKNKSLFFTPESNCTKCKKKSEINFKNYINN